ncbi:MAG: NAD(P)H-quinone oxidoreductase chain 4, partial [Alphaproteobacteria bacterium MarineAlpha5_Bin8]
MFIWPLLSVTIFLPLFGSIVILLIREDEKSSNNIKWAALCTSIGTFILSCLIWLFFDSSISSYQLVEKYKWFDDFNFYYH